MSSQAKQQFTLRAYQNSDLQDLFILMTDQLVNQYLSLFVHNILLETKRYIDDVIESQDYYYVIEDNDKQHVIGYMRLSNIDEWHIHGELEYALLKEYWGKEIICNIFDEFIVQLKKQHFEYIYVKNNQNNRRSERVIEKVGMVYSKQTNELWKPKNLPITFKWYIFKISDYVSI